MVNKAHSKRSRKIVWSWKRLTGFLRAEYQPSWSGHWTFLPQQTWHIDDKSPVNGIIIKVKWKVEGEMERERGSCWWERRTYRDRQMGREKQTGEIVNSNSILSFCYSLFYICDFKHILCLFVCVCVCVCVCARVCVAWWRVKQCPIIILRWKGKIQTIVESLTQGIFYRQTACLDSNIHIN